MRTSRSDLKRLIDDIFSGDRVRICLVCGEPFGAFDMHEGIVSRQDVRGWKPAAKKLIMTEWNCIPLHHDCNLNRPPPRQAVWDYQKMFYSVEVLLDWYNGLPWKSGRPPRYFEKET